MTLRPGVHNVAATPFLPDESLDEASLRSLVEYCVASGCEGMLILGVLGEADRLSDEERERTIAGFVAASSGRLQITVGITHQSTVVTRCRADAALAMGADAVMVSPPVGSNAGPALREHFLRIADGLAGTLVVQDHPASSGVKMPTAFLAELGAALPAGSVVKLEEPPTAAKMAALRATTDAFQLFGGLGGVSLLHELDAGADGTMTGFALPDALARIVAAHRAGDRAEARRLYADYLPLMVFEAQPGAGVALRKELLRRRGAIACAAVRQPAPKPDAFSLAALSGLLADLEMLPTPGGGA
ncbi:MAG: dihydrodipicolinate synthase family protein [Thermomicrobiales bacterium]|nr:dihydrodipicolinate synthase family protein [Thermomicrobiales bacterium]